MNIAASTGEIDKRTINGNNGVKRGKDKKKRKRKTGYYVLKDEVKAGLRARLDAVFPEQGRDFPFRVFHGPPVTIFRWMLASADIMEQEARTLRRWKAGAVCRAGLSGWERPGRLAEATGIEPPRSRPDFAQATAEQEQTEVQDGLAGGGVGAACSSAFSLRCSALRRRLASFFCFLAISRWRLARE